MSTFAWQAVVCFAAVSHFVVVSGNKNKTVPAYNDTTVWSNSSQTVVSPGQTGRGLWCYECREAYRDAYENTLYDASDSPCLNNLSRIVVRQCSQDDRYCQVERSELSGTVMTIERGCTRVCLYGCRFNGFGLTTMRCRSCCNTHGCNTGNASPVTTSLCQVYILFPILVATMNIFFGNCS